MKRNVNFIYILPSSIIWFE